MGLIVKAKSWDEPLSKHFSLKEFRCKCELDDCQVTRVDQDIVDLLEEVREFLTALSKHDFPIKITSGYRCEKHNEATLDGAPGSYHVRGLAADILVPNKYHQAIANLVGERGGVGFYEDRLHLDRRGHFARWGKIPK